MGDELVVMDSERAVKKLSEERLEELRQEKLTKPHKARLQDIWEDDVDEEDPRWEIIRQLVSLTFFGSAIPSVPLIDPPIKTPIK